VVWFRYGRKRRSPYSTSTTLALTSKTNTLQKTSEVSNTRAQLTKFLFPHYRPNFGLDAERDGLVHPQDACLFGCRITETDFAQVGNFGKSVDGWCSVRMDSAC
jgi:hypothetical protein